MQRVPAHCTMKILRPFRGIEGSGGLPVSPPYGSRCLHVSRHTCLHPRLLAVALNWGEPILSFFSGSWSFFSPSFLTLIPGRVMEYLFPIFAAVPLAKIEPHFPPYCLRASRV